MLNKSVSTNDYSGFLDMISQYNNKIISNEKTMYIKMFANIFLLFIFIMTLIVSLKK